MFITENITIAVDEEEDERSIHSTGEIRKASRFTANVSLLVCRLSTYSCFTYVKWGLQQRRKIRLTPTLSFSSPLSLSFSPLFSFSPSTTLSRSLPSLRFYLILPTPYPSLSPPPPSHSLRSLYLILPTPTPTSLSFSFYPPSHFTPSLSFYPLSNSPLSIVLTTRLSHALIYCMTFQVIMKIIIIIIMFSYV